MAKAVITRYSNEARDWSRLSQGQALAVLGACDGDRITLNLDDGTAKNTDAADAAGLYRIKIIGADVTLRIGEGANADATGELWEDGETDLRFLAKGQRISIKKEV